MTQNEITGLAIFLFFAATVYFTFKAYKNTNKD